MNKQAQKADSCCMAKHVNLLGFVPWLRGCPLCCTVVFRTVGRRSDCIFIFGFFNSSAEYFGVGGSSWIHCLLESSGQAGDRREL